MGGGGGGGLLWSILGKYFVAIESQVEDSWRTMLKGRLDNGRIVLSS